MMAGDVTAAIVNGDLVVTGDAAANGVRVEYMAYDAWRVTGFMTSFTAGGATRVNGQSIVEFNASSVTGAIRVNLGGGNDVGQRPLAFGDDALDHALDLRIS